MTRIQGLFSTDREGHNQMDEVDLEGEILANEDYIKSLNAEERRAKVREGIRTGSLLLLGLTAIGFLLIYLDFIMIPLVFSRGLVYVFQPFINYFVGKKPIPCTRYRMNFPRWFAVFLCVILIIVVFFLIGLMVEFSARQVLLEKDQYVRRFEEIYANAITFAEGLGYTQEQIEVLLEQLDLTDYMFELIQEFISQLPNIFLILLFTLYMLLDYDEKAHKTKLRQQVDYQIRQYIIIKVGVSVFVGFAVGLTFLLLGAHLALFFGLMTFVLNFIPNIGAIVATFLPMPVVLFDPNMNWIKILFAFFTPFTIHMIVGNVLEPKIIGHSLEMPPVSVLVVLMFWESVWGILGALISVPLTVAITTYLQAMDHPMPRMLAGMLSGDFSWLENTMNEDKAETTARHHQHGEPSVVDPVDPHHQH